MPKVMHLMENAASGSGRIRYLPSGEEHTFADIWAGSEKSARWIHSRVGTGGAVGAILSNTPACGSGLLGTWRSGNTLVSLQQPGRGMTVQRYRAQMLRIAELTGVTHVLIDAQYAALVPDDLPITVATFQDTLAGGPPCDTAGSGDLIQFTSGSVGSPKGVVLSAEAIGAHIRSLIEVIEPVPGDVPCSWLPLSHDMGLIGMYLTSFACLGPSILGKGLFALLSPEYFLRQPAAWLQVCSEVGATVTAAPNFALELACRARAHSGSLDLSRLRMVITGAERVSAPTLRRFAGCFAEAGFRSRALSPAYGMAEATLAVTMVRPGEQWRSAEIDREALSNGRWQPGSGPRAAEYVGNGRPVPGTDVRVAAAEGRVGEVQVRGPSLLSSYVGAGLRLTDDGWFSTRDLGVLTGGELFLVGRTDDTVIIGGRNYYAPDIEAMLAHDAVRPGCLAAVPLDGAGYGLVAEVHATVPATDLERVCRELALRAVADAGLRPSVVAIVPRGQLPKTPSGKLQRVRLADQLRSGDIEVTASVSLGG